MSRQADGLRRQMYQPWGFGPDAAALLIARTAWPWETDEQRRSWSKRLTDPADRALLDREYAHAQARLDSAYAALAALDTGGAS